jgi:thiamine-phosphate pyrophosphorylase
LSGSGDRRPFELYLITDRKLARRGLIAACEEALAAAKPFGRGIAIQLREKDLSGRELLELARELRKVCSRYGAKLIINDRLDVAIACDADGVHLPANSFSVADARKLLGPVKLIGCSTHSIDEVQVAHQAAADFVVFGPVFDPISKDGYGRATGVEMLRGACEAASIPVYALGGITPNRVRELRDAGISGVAVIGSVFGAESIADATRELMRAIADHLA